jgi:subtilisin family serine protease
MKSRLRLRRFLDNRFERLENRFSPINMLGLSLGLGLGGDLIQEPSTDHEDLKSLPSLMANQASQAPPKRAIPDSALYVPRSFVASEENHEVDRLIKSSGRISQSFPLFPAFVHERDVVFASFASQSSTDLHEDLFSTILAGIERNGAGSNQVGQLTGVGGVSVSPLSLPIESVTGVLSRASFPQDSGSSVGPLSETGVESSGESTPVPVVNSVQPTGPGTDVVTPHQRQRPSSANRFYGDFVVKLSPTASSESLAISNNLSHSYAYANSGENLNVWTASGNSLRRVSNNPERFAERLKRNPQVLDAYPVFEPIARANGFTNDPLLSAQWHLANDGHSGGTVGVDANVRHAWDYGVSGRGATISIVDEGVQGTHVDLEASFDPIASYDFIGTGDDDPSPDGTGDDCFSSSANSSECHGTAVAGVAAAVGDNGIGVAGAAPNATIGSSRILANPGGASSIGIASALSPTTTRVDGGGGGYDASRIDVSNNSWGYAGGVLVSQPVITNAINSGALLGRGGLGTIYVFSAGNERAEADGQGDVNYASGSHNSRHAIAVAATGDGGLIAPYSSPGAPILIAAPSNGSGEGITTTDLDDSSGTANGYHRTDYTEDFGGTSSAAPLVSGVVALVLQANPNLTNRDVQHVLIDSATRDGLSATGWSANQSGREFSHDYGFGLINAAGAVTLASNWQPVSPEVFINSGRQIVDTAVDDVGTAVTSSVVVAPNIRVEAVEVVLNATHAQRDDLEVTLEHLGSVTTTSRLTRTRASDAAANYSNFMLMSRAHWGELSSGTWRLSVRDGSNNAVTGTFDNWTLRIFGTEVTADTAGPRVARTEVNAQQLHQGQVTGFQIQFSEPISPASFTAADISLERVGGSPIAINTITPVAGTNDTTFDVTFASQATAGNYRIEIGPSVTDVMGNSMNQDGDASNNEATEDKFTDFFTIGTRYIYANSSASLIPDGSGQLTRNVSLPAINVADVDALVRIQHTFPSHNLRTQLSAPGVADVTIIGRNTSNVNGSGNNGYLDTLLDDDDGSAPSISATTTNFHYTGQYLPSNSLSAFDGNRAAGNWTLTIDDNSTGFQGAFFSYSLIVTPAAMFDIGLNSVTNTDSDRDKVEVSYTVRNPAGGLGTAPSFNLVAYDSSDPFFNINSDTKIGTGFTVTETNCAAGTGCLTGGPHTLELDASLFPDPSFARSSQLHSLLVVDPDRLVLDSTRHNNYGILSGVTSAPDGTLHVAGSPFSSNTITISGTDVNLNGSIIPYSSATTNDIFVAGGTEPDVINAAGVNENILAVLGNGSDTFTGGDLIDAVLGGAGNDTLVGNSGGDRLYGMEGTDSVSGGSGADTVSVGQGGIAGQVQVLNGGTENDYLLIDGTTKNDRITVWDPDGNTGTIGNTLQARVSSFAGTVSAGTLVNGADNFGYVARKTNFQSLDLVPGASGVTTLLNGVDNASASINLGAHTFNYYGTNLTQLFASSNGLISIGTGISNSTNIDISSSFFANFPLIAPFWDDLQTNVGGSGDTDSTVLFNLDSANNRLIIEWSNVPHSSGIGAATFQAILQLNTGNAPGEITFNYVDVDFGDPSFNNGASATVGIQLAAASNITAVNQILFDGTGAASSIVTSGSAFVFTMDTGFNSAVTQDVGISGVEAGDVLLVNASLGNDEIRLTNSSVANSAVGINAYLIGGPGNDSLFDGLGADTLVADSAFTNKPTDGTDDLHSSADGKVDRLVGRNGTDSFDNQGGEDVLIFTT